jgi:hypothetical protein
MAKKLKPFTVDEYVNECILNAAEIICPRKHELLRPSAFLQTQ